MTRFNQWLNNCVSGRLDDIDPVCKEQARDVSGATIDPASVAVCIIKGAGGRTDLAECIGPKLIGLWEYWSSNH